MSDAKYNGHKNHATWAVSLWAGNDEGLYHEMGECLAGRHGTPIAATIAREVVEEWMEIDSLPGIASEIVNAALGTVDWDAVAGAFANPEFLLGDAGADAP